MKNDSDKILIKRFNEVFDLDYQNGNLIWKIDKSKRTKAGTVAGYVSSCGYVKVVLDYKLLRVHRIIFAMVNGYLPEEVDHIDGNPLNNKPSNLRAATRAQNSYNTGLRKDNTSGVKGVTWDKNLNKWAARCWVNGKTHYLGTFKNIDDASKNVEEFRKSNHREFARHIDLRQ